MEMNTTLVLTDSELKAVFNGTFEYTSELKDYKFVNNAFTFLDANMDRLYMFPGSPVTFIKSDHNSKVCVNMVYLEEPNRFNLDISVAIDEDVALKTIELASLPPFRRFVKSVLGLYGAMEDFVTSLKGLN